MSHRKVVTIQNCGAQLVHMRDNTVESVLGVLDKLEAWFHPNHYILMEIKMVIVKDWGDKINYASLGVKNLEKKLIFCEELEKNVEVLEGSMSRTKGFILLSFLKTLDFMKMSEIPITPEKLKRIPSLKKELYEIFKADAGAPENYDVFMAI